MSRKSGLAAYRNRLLSALEPDDAAALQPHLESSALPQRKTVEEPNKNIEYVYFPESGMVSMLGRSASKRDTDVEIGVIGPEGMTGLPVLFGNHRSPHHSFVQIAGEANRISAGAFRTILDERRSVQQLLLKYAQAFLMQTTHTAVANARGSLEQRLARWLLMAQDRAESEILTLTHEFLSLMLAVRRPGVTESVNEFTRKGLIAHERGVVNIKDRKGLIEIAGGLYGTPESEYKRLLG